MRTWNGRRAETKAELALTPMIDVVFLLLIFFIVTLRPEDVVARLEVARPSVREVRKVEVELLEILISEHGCSVRGLPVSLRELDARLKKLAGYSRSLPVVVKSTADCRHSRLVRLLDVCAKHGLRNISLVSL